jgi:23S rRNA (adenine2503-C2)-methyltransferase
MTERISLRNLTEEEMKELAQNMGQPAFRGTQLFKWIQSGVRDFDEMSNIPAVMRKTMSDTAKAGNMKLKSMQRSASDGTEKYLFELDDGNHIETVLMKYEYGNSICISSQVGCAMGCAFCASARNGFVRNLTAGEMLGQVLEVQRESGVRISRTVVMGIGEPLCNYDELCRFIELIHHRDGMNMSLRNITVSTCGLIPEMEKFAEEHPQVNLALSLHAPNDSLRKKIMPIAEKYSVASIVEAAKRHVEKTGRRISFEYALMDGVNDDDSSIEELSVLLKGMNCHINLIPLNRVSESAYSGTSAARVREIAGILENRGLNVTVRRKLGEDIDGACGQLRLRVK